jgi:hypothetical protein
VILSIGPYFNHSGQTGPAGPVEGTSYDPVGASGPQPSDRFKDFVLGHLRTADLNGYKRPARLEQRLSAAPFTVPPSTITSSTRSGFQLPPRQTR